MKKIKNGIGIVMLVLGGLVNAASANQEIGKIYDYMPQQEEDADHPAETSPTCRYLQNSDAPGLENYEILIAECDGRRAQAWLGKINKSLSTDKRREYVVVDFLSLGTLKKGEFVSPPVCLMDNLNSHYNWVAIYRNKKPNKNREKYTHQNGGVVQAWVVNPDTQRFELASPDMLKKMVCQPEEYD